MVPNERNNLKSLGVTSVPVRVRLPAPIKKHPVRGASLLILIRLRTRTDLNATVQWTVAHARLDGHDTLIFARGENANRVRLPAPYRVFITDLTVVDTRFFVFSLGRVMCRQKSAHFFAYYHSRNNNLGIGKYKKSLLVVEMISKGVYTEL